MKLCTLPASFSLPAAMLIAFACVLSPVHGKEKKPAPPKAYEPAALDAREPQLRVEFPGGARTRAATSGTASVSVFVGADGSARDFLVTSYTDPAFGKALEEKARTLKYQAARMNGVPVPGRVDMRYQFDIGDIAMNTLEASANRGVKPKLVHTITPESKLDEKLQFASVALPRLPADFKVTEGQQPPRVAVTFYIDGEGSVRCPQAEAAPSPELATAAMEAVSLWTFQPPLAKGKPALVLKEASVRFNPPITE